ncbi:MAG TPA: GDSL-type esterase/lipase family protein, partial [Marmoricola sp.]|nr:GDSL-type esterase/lipase family protein [Marmoricola sp.]
GMRKIFGAVLLVLATTMTGVVGVPGTAAHADNTGVLRIMLAGDSITQGFDGDYTWRYRLYEALTQMHVSFDFVGPRTEPYGGRDVYLATGWDTDHDAKGGTTLNAQLENITADMTAYQPDVLVALYGTNDLHNGATPDQLMDRWRNYIAQARAVRPDVKLILGETYAQIAYGHAEANDKLHELASELSTPESPILVADLDNPDFVLSRDTYDHTHPTPTGETLIAQKVLDQLQVQGVVPEAPQIASPYVPWAPPVKPVVHRVGQRLVLDWLGSKHRYRAREMRVRWTNLRTGRTSTTRWARWPNHKRTGVLAPGRYRVQAQASRRSMVSLWGPAVIRRVPRH